MSPQVARDILRSWRSFAPARSRLRPSGQSVFWLLTAPAVVLTTLFTYLPIVRSLVSSIYVAERGGKPQALSLAHYEAMANDPVFHQALWNTALYGTLVVTVSLILAMIMALWVNSKIRGRGVLRLAFFSPVILPTVAAATIWQFFYLPNFGAVNRGLAAVGLPTNDWLGNPDTVLWSLAAIAIWKNSGLFMIFLLAGLQQIPPTLVEAARLEGAGQLAMLRRVILPLLMPTILFVIITGLVEAVVVIDYAVALTGGGPVSASQLALLYIYQTAFKYWDQAYASAMSVVVLGCLGALLGLKVFLLNQRVFYR